MDYVHTGLFDLCSGDVPRLPLSCLQDIKGKVTKRQAGVFAWNSENLSLKNQFVHGIWVSKQKMRKIVPDKVGVLE